MNPPIKKPNKLSQMILPQLKPGSEFLDLGCGQGADSIFMAENGFLVTAIDNSPAVIAALQKRLAENDLLKEKIKLYCQDISTFEIEKDKYQIINAFNSLQFLDKNIGLEVIKKIKENLPVGGMVVLSGFTIDDAFYQTSVNKNSCCFKPQELKEIFSDLEITFYEERIIDDLGHPGYEEPHQHCVVRMVARKK
jgi:tellurite methyltransferase